MAAEPASRPGQAGEDLACAHLVDSGMRILARNYRCRVGEIDLVARDGETLVFVEVKERSGRSHGAAIEAVTPLKRRRIVRAARHYAAGHGGLELAVRFDVVAIDRDPAGDRVRHERGAFGEE